MTIKRLEDLDMTYMLSYENEYDGISVSFKAQYVTAKDIEADGPIASAQVQKANQTLLFKGDDLTNLPLEIRCVFQEG